jgi:hypothetical protein
MYAIVDKKNNDRIGEHISGQLLVFLTFEDAQARYDKSGFAEFSKHDGTVDWQIAPVMVLVAQNDMVCGTCQEKHDSGNVFNHNFVRRS